jgi:hypothetical protein
MLTYDTPGTYTLTPNDYNNADQLLVEIWGAGGGGSFGYGGGSGSYIKALVIPNLLSFNIIIGTGQIVDNGYNINDNSASSMTSIELYPYINLKMGGSNFYNAGVPKLWYGVNILQMLSGDNGQLSGCNCTNDGSCGNPLYINGAGANATAGGYGCTIDEEIHGFCGSCVDMEFVISVNI